MIALQWTLGTYLLVQGCILALSLKAAEEFDRTGLPTWIRLALAWSEIAAALLFLLPATLPLGGVALLAVLFAAIALHLYLGQNPAVLVVYLVSVIVVLVHRRPPSTTTRVQEISDG
jgi:hypothetical protein